MNREYAAWIVQRSAPSYFASSLKISGFHLKLNTLLRTSADVATRPWRTPRHACRRSRAVAHPGVCQRSINGCHAVASSGCLWRCLSRRASKNSRNVLYCAAIASLIARNSFVASVSIVDSFHFKWGAYFWWDQSSLFYCLSY